jgi:ATP-binding cassette subfamily F protein 3
MREALTEALNDFTGALVLVAHDRALIRACCDTLLHVGGGKVSPYDGDLDDYARLVMRNDAASAAQAPASGGGSRRDERRARAEQRARLAPLREQVKHLEKRMAELDSSKRKTDTALADPSMLDASQTARVSELTRLTGKLTVELDELETQWLHAQAELEQANAI